MAVEPPRTGTSGKPADVLTRASRIQPRPPKNARRTRIPPTHFLLQSSEPSEDLEECTPPASTRARGRAQSSGGLTGWHEWGKARTPQSARVRPPEDCACASERATRARRSP